MSYQFGMILSVILLCFGAWAVEPTARDKYERAAIGLTAILIAGFIFGVMFGYSIK